ESATPQPSEVIVQPGESMREAEAYEALVGPGTYCSERRIVWPYTGVTCGVELRHQTVRCQDEGLHVRLRMAGQQRPTHGHGIVLDGKQHPALGLGAACLTADDSTCLRREGVCHLLHIGEGSRGQKILWLCTIVLGQALQAT